MALRRGPVHSAPDMKQSSDTVGVHIAGDVATTCKSSVIPSMPSAPAVDAPAQVRCLVVVDEAAKAQELRERLRSLRHPRATATVTVPARLMDAIRTGNPQVLILDMDHAAVDPLYFTKSVRCFKTDTPILIVTGRADSVLASRLLRAGAQGYLLLEDWPTEIGRALSLLSGGACFVSERIMQDILHNLGDYQNETAPEGVETLSDRELIVFQFIGQGHPSNRIARELHVTTRTVSGYRINIKRKMHLDSDEALLAYAQDWVRRKNATS